MHNEHARETSEVFGLVPHDHLNAALIKQHRISYIYVGQLEQAVYDPAGLTKFEQMREEGYLDLVYENARVKIYRVTGFRQ